MKKIPRKKVKAAKRAVVTVTIHGAAEMSDDERHGIYDWLHKQGCDLIDEGWNYAGRFTARYYE